uniref:Uncharacterized protein n=1 Tax=Meloidogyne enterolobii TaxID=390850 RepID=A0A6V7UIS9_MELEN|nr:unnamed protein product [Meloidogyne enterolobii]
MYNEAERTDDVMRLMAIYYPGKVTKTPLQKELNMTPKVPAIPIITISSPLKQQTLARKSEKVFGKPGLGPKEAEGEKRQWTPHQLKAGETIIGLQAGSNKGATQSGMVNKIKHSKRKHVSKSERKKRGRTNAEIKKKINEGRSNAEIKKLINKEKKRREEVKNKKRN